MNPVAVEEAAHAVIAERLGMPVRAITIVPSRHYAGIVHFSEQHIPSDVNGLMRLRLQLRVNGLVALAGPAAYAAFAHEPIGEVLRRSGRGDWREARRCATGLALASPSWSADARERVFDKLLAEARRMVREDWPTIMVLAGRLALNGSLNASDVCRTIMLASKQAAA